MNTTIAVADYAGLDGTRLEMLVGQGIRTHNDLAALEGNDERLQKISESIGVSAEQMREWMTCARKLCSKLAPAPSAAVMDMADDAKIRFLHDYFNQVETQVQFADTRAALLVGGDSILLAVNMGLLQAFAGVTSGKFSWVNVHPKVAFLLALGGALFLVISLAYALLSALPSKVHGHPPAQFFLLSHVAGLSEADFVRSYEQMSASQMALEALCAIHGKAMFATRRFARIKKAIWATLMSIFLQVLAVLAAGLVMVLS